MTPEELILEWGYAWCTRDDAERARRFGACCTEDVEFVPPDERPVIRGRQALIDHVSEYTSQWPAGVECRLVRPVETHHGWTRSAVRWVFPQAAADASDIFRVADGRIAQMVVFADPAQ